MPGAGSIKPIRLCQLKDVSDRVRAISLPRRKPGVHALPKAWIPASAGMRSWQAAGNIQKLLELCRSSVHFSPEEIIDLRIQAALQVEDEVLLCSVLATCSFHAAQSQLKGSRTANGSQLVIAPDSRVR